MYFPIFPFALLVVGVENVQGIEAGVDYGHPVMGEMLNKCIDSQNHKSSPGPEDVLHQQCSPWKDRSCCHHNTTVKVHGDRMYSFDWNHCSAKKPLSPKCRAHFVQDLCFYECSPNVGPWTVKVNNKFRKERFYKVPLCASECEGWFRDCEDDYTCTDNWTLNMIWLKGLGNACPQNSTCRTFKEVYGGSAKVFCETVWDHSWEVVGDGGPCMKMWFEGDNPNDKVALWKAEQKMKEVHGQVRGWAGAITTPPVLPLISAFCSVMMNVI